MHARKDPSTELLSLARSQCGVLSAAQVASAGQGRSVTRRLVAEGNWSHLAHGFYYAAPGQITWEVIAFAGLMRGGRGAVVGGRAAAVMHGIHRNPPERITIYIRPDARVHSTDLWHFVRSSYERKSILSCPRATSLPDTILDLCDLEPHNAEFWTDRGLMQGDWVLDAIEKTLAGRPRCAGRYTVTKLVAQHRNGIQSRLEFLYHRDVEKAHGLPESARQVVHGRIRADVEYFGRLIVELDGKLGHTGSGRFRDMRRDNVNLVNGRMTLRYGWDDITQRPCDVVVQVRTVLEKLGVQVPFKRCKRCGIVSTAG